MKEIGSIDSLLKSKFWKVKKFTGNEAIEEAVKSSKNPRILHIATHGIFLNQKDAENVSLFDGKGNMHEISPLFRSMLFLTGAENTLQQNNSDSYEDGILTAYEAMNLQLDKTDAVILSACQTGLGDIENGEGVLGLQRSFQVAGARYVVMSLWPVNDNATQELMTIFYNKWLSGIQIRKAFKDAQLELKIKYPNFYFWGAFVMVGN
jgi:CHAT domain-containing protein